MKPLPRRDRPTGRGRPTATGRSRRHAAPLVAFLLMLASGCGLHQRIPGFGPERDGILLVRHSETGPLDVWADDIRLGEAAPDRVTCFSEAPTGSYRIEARSPGSDRSAGTASLTRATEITLPPEQPLLWDIDHDQVLSGRIHAALCAG